MRTLQRHLVWIGLIAMGVSWLLLSLGGAASAGSETKALCSQCDETGRFVRLQQVTEDRRSTHPRQFTHPVVLRPEEWTTLLKGLQVQRQAEGIFFRDPPGPVLPAFTPEEIGYLSTALSQAFAQAQPHEWVVFGLTRLNAYSMTEVTTGGWFVEGTSLHLVLANYRKVVTMPSTRQLLWERPLRPDAGPYHDLVAGRHQTIVRESSVISNLLSSVPSELVVVYPGILLDESVADPTRQEPPNPVFEIGPSSISIENRFRVLKRLHDAGLISEEEYQTKKQQLLDRF